MSLSCEDYLEGIFFFSASSSYMSREIIFGYKLSGNAMGKSSENANSTRHSKYGENFLFCRAVTLAVQHEESKTCARKLILLTCVPG